MYAECFLYLCNPKIKLLRKKGYHNFTVAQILEPA